MRPALTRSSIVNAARELLVAEGLEAVSLRRIASHLGVTAPALYAYVTDKLDLLRAIATLEVEALLAEIDALGREDPIDQLRSLALVYGEFARANIEVFRAVFLTRPELMAQPIDGAPPLASRIFDRVRNLVADACEAGILDPEDSAMAALAFWSAVHGAVVMLVSGPRLHPDDEASLVRITAETVLAGLGADSRTAAASR